MTNITKAFFLLVFAFSCAAHANVNATKVKYADPYAMLSEVTKSTFDRITIEKSKIEAKPSVLHTIIEQELMPYTHHEYTGYKVLGNNVKKISKQDLNTFFEVFRPYLVRSYASVLKNYDNQTVEIESAKDTGNKKSVDIKAIIKNNGGPDISIQFKMVKVSKTGDWLLYDIVAEGISLVSSKRSEFATIIRKEGIQALIDKINSSSISS